MLPGFTATVLMGRVHAATGGALNRQVVMTGASGAILINLTAQRQYVAGGAAINEA
jgi:hypothetical protein